MTFVGDDSDDSGIKVGDRGLFVSIFIDVSVATGSGEARRISDGARGGRNINKAAAGGEIVGDNSFGFSRGDGVEAEEADRRGGVGAVGGFDGSFENARVNGKSSSGDVSSRSGAVIVLNPNNAVR